MKRNVSKTLLIALLIIETLIIVALVLPSPSNSALSGKKTVLCRDVSPDGKYCVLIEENGSPDWPFGSDHLSIALYENNDEHSYSVRFNADVATDGGQADYEVEWLDDGVQIALIGNDQPTCYYILPFKTLKELK